VPEGIFKNRKYLIIINLRSKVLKMGYAAGYVTCWFPAMEGLVKLSTLTGEKKYLDAAISMAAFYQQFDKLPIDHAHGMLCCQVSLLLLHEAT
jgi:hypothetical protein